MLKLLEATCSASGEVKVGADLVPEAVVMSEGKQASSGIVLIEGETAKYIVLSASDLKTTIEKVADALTKVANLLTSIGGGMTGSSTAPPPTLSADVSALNQVVTDLTTLKGALK